jgi:hypothetical protein
MKLKTYVKVSVIMLLFSFSIEAPGGFVPISEDTLFKARKIEFYYRAYTQDFSEELLKECIYYEKIQHPDVVLAQSKLETNYYTSELFWVANNVFGMRLARTRETAADGIYNYHARYLHWTDSVKDYKLWQDYYISLGYRIDNYFVFLQYIRYATDGTYVTKIKYMS